MVFSQMKYFTDIARTHKGKRIIVMGGGPMLADDIEDLKGDIWISVNDHGAKLRPVDYVVAMDDIHCEKKVNMINLIREVTDAPIIGPFRQNDIFLTDWPGYPRRKFSGLVATWIAWALGGWPVILAGFSGYAGEGRQADRHARQVGLFDEKIIGKVRVVGRTIGNSWPVFDRSERYGRYSEHSRIRGIAGIDEEIKIKVRKRSWINEQYWPPGDELRVARHEVIKQLKHGMVIEI